MESLTSYGLECSSFRDDWECRSHSDREEGNPDGHLSQMIIENEEISTFDQPAPEKNPMDIMNVQKTSGKRTSLLIIKGFRLMRSPINARNVGRPLNMVHD